MRACAVSLTQEVSLPEMKWKREQKQKVVKVKKKPPPPPEPSEPIEAPVASGEGAAEGGAMPEGMTKMEEMKWRREQKRLAASGAAVSAPSAETAGGEGGGEAMPEGMTKLDQMKWKRERARAQQQSAP